MIKFLFWNIRGISRAPNLRRLKSLIAESSLQLVAICEPKVCVGDIQWIRLNLRMDRCITNSEGSIWVFYPNSLVCDHLGESSQHLSLNIQSPMVDGPMVFSFVHAKCNEQDRRSLWSMLLLDNPIDAPWFLVGDFNVIVSEEEKRGGLPFRLGEGLDFICFMASARVRDAGFSGSKFTWCNNRGGVRVFGRG